MAVHVGGRGPGHMVRTPLAAGGAPVGALISSINGPTGGPVGAPDYLEGWSAQWASGTPPTFTPDSSPVTFSVTRQGYDATGSTTTYTDTYTYTARVRQPFPNQASLSASTVALSDVIYPTDSISGVTNNSTKTSPVPILIPAMIHRTVIGNSLYWEALVFHRDARAGKQVPCVIATATDGTTTVSQTISTPTISAKYPDKYPVISYSGTLDITTLTDNHLITWNCTAYPWIGAAASVATTVGGTDPRGASPRYFLKHTAKLAAPPIAYVSTTGSDTTGTWSTNPATAAASPYATVGMALYKGRTGGAQAATTGGILDGCEIRVGPGVTLDGLPASNTTQNIACVTITRDPANARGLASQFFLSSTISFGCTTGLTAPLTTAAFRFKDCSLKRTGNGNIGNSASLAGELFWDDVDIDNNAQITTLQNTGSPLHYWWFGANITNTTGVSLATPQGTYTQRIIRGVDMDIGGSLRIDACPTVGCFIRNIGGLGNATSDFSGYGIAFNRFLISSTSGGIIGPGPLSATGTLNGYFIVQNVFEFIGNAGTDVILDADGSTFNTTHVVVFNNTMTGAGSHGRSNWFYDELGGTTHKKSVLMASKGNIHSQINTKGDWFLGVNGNGTPNPTDAPTRLGNWQYLHGAGCQAEFTQFMDANGGGIGTPFAQEYAGLASNIGTSLSVRNDPLFTNYQGTGGTNAAPTTGAGGGTYTVAGGSPCKSRLTTSVLICDLAGTARPTTGDTTGAYT